MFRERWKPYLTVDHFFPTSVSHFCPRQILDYRLTSGGDHPKRVLWVMERQLDPRRDGEGSEPIPSSSGVIRSRAHEMVRAITGLGHALTIFPIYDQRRNSLVAELQQAGVEVYYDVNRLRHRSNYQRYKEMMRQMTTEQGDDLDEDYDVEEETHQSSLLNDRLKVFQAFLKKINRDYDLVIISNRLIFSPVVKVIKDVLPLSYIIYDAGEGLRALKLQPSYLANNADEIAVSAFGDKIIESYQKKQLKMNAATEDHRRTNSSRKSMRELSIFQSADETWFVSQIDRLVVESNLPENYLLRSRIISHAVTPVAPSSVVSSVSWSQRSLSVGFLGSSHSDRHKQEEENGAVLRLMKTIFPLVRKRPGCKKATLFIHNHLTSYTTSSSVGDRPTKSCSRSQSRKDGVCTLVDVTTSDFFNRIRVLIVPHQLSNLKINTSSNQLTYSPLFTLGNTLAYQKS